MCSRSGSAAQSGRGFTLIELLLVISIIAMLMALLLPSLSAAREQAKKSVCLSRLKNIASSSAVYESGDENGYGIPVHPKQYQQDTNKPTFIGAYEWGGKSGVGRPGFSDFPGELGSKYGTHAGFGPATRPLNEILYAGGFPNYAEPFDRVGAQNDTTLKLDAFQCPADDGPPKAAHCPDWLANPDQPSFDHFGTSYAANLFMVGCGGFCAVAPHISPGQFASNSPYLRPISRVPTPARTIYYEENIGRWAWACHREWCDGSINGLSLPGLDPGPTKALAGWHGKDWTYTRAFVDAHAEYQKVYVEGTEDKYGYAQHYRSEPVLANSEGQLHTACVIVRGDGWQKDTLPAEFIETGLKYTINVRRASYEDCVAPGLND